MRQLSSRTKVKQGSGGKKGAFKIVVQKKGVGGRKKVGGPDLDTLSALYSPRALLVVTRVLEAVSAWEKGSRIGKVNQVSAAATNSTASSLVSPVLILLLLSWGIP